MNKIAIAFLAAASLASFGCKKKGGDMAFEKHVDAICACKGDKACMDKENGEFKGTPPAADDPKGKELAEKLAGCMTPAAGGGAAGGGMAGGAAGGGAAAGGTPPAGGSGEAPAAGGTPPAGGSGEAPAAGGTPPAGGSGEAPAAGSGSAAK